MISGGKASVASTVVMPRSRRTRRSWSVSTGVRCATWPGGAMGGDVADGQLGQHLAELGRGPGRRPAPPRASSVHCCGRGRRAGRRTGCIEVRGRWRCAEAARCIRAGPHGRASAERGCHRWHRRTSGRRKDGSADPDEYGVEELPPFVLIHENPTMPPRTARRRSGVRQWLEHLEICRDPLTTLHMML